MTAALVQCHYTTLRFVFYIVVAQLANTLSEKFFVSNIISFNHVSICIFTLCLISHNMRWSSTFYGESGRERESKYRP